MLHLSSTVRYFIYSGKTDMRKGFDSLSGIVRSELGENPLSGDVFVFLNKNKNQVKLLFWEGDGFSLYYKRLEKGTYELPVSGNKKCEISAADLRLILEGIILSSVRKKKRFSFENNIVF